MRCTVNIVTTIQIGHLTSAGKGNNYRTIDIRCNSRHSRRTFRSQSSQAATIKTTLNGATCHSDVGGCQNAIIGS